MVSRLAGQLSTREGAWHAVLALLADGWHLRPATYDPALDRWSVTARSPNHAGRFRSPAAVTGIGKGEVGALADLALQLRELHHIERRMEMDLTARKGFIAAAESHSMRTRGRQLTHRELEAILARYPRPRTP